MTEEEEENQSDGGEQAGAEGEGSTEEGTDSRYQRTQLGAEPKRWSTCLFKRKKYICNVLFRFKGASDDSLAHTTNMRKGVSEVMLDRFNRPTKALCNVIHGNLVVM